jgi:endonuclease/exonuclease/phosphatase family metal-dependent hydrolase
MKKCIRILFLALLTIGLLSSNAEKPLKTTILKIMSYNIRHGEGMDNLLDLSRSAEVIKSQAPDICGLQEVDEYCSRTDSVGQTEYLSEKTTMKGTFGKFMNYQGGEYGLATLILKPLISSKVLQLPDGKYEPRVAIVHEVQIEKGCIIAFANVHFDWISEKEGAINRLNQAKALVKYIDELKRPTVITGDFNCTPDSPTMKYFAEQGFIFVQKGADNLSFQGKEKGEIDHVIYRNAGKVKFKSKSIKLLNEPIVSDHRPLIAELEVAF